MSNTERQVRCYFGILNLSGLMNMKDVVIDGVTDYSQVNNPIFSTQSYTIKTTFNKSLSFKDRKDDEGNSLTTHYFGTLYFNDQNPYDGAYYQKKFRRDVMWDFGDGTVKTGYSAEHSYKKPGRYKITCTFFDINRRALTNSYCIYVIVKEVLPTILRFNKELFGDDIIKKTLKCSKIERVARIEALNSNTVTEPLNINGQRIFTQEQHEEKYQEIGKKFEQLPDTTFRFMDKYWGFLNNTQELYYNSEKVHSIYLEPSNTFHPRYTDIYAKFYYIPAKSDDKGQIIQDDKLGISMYQIIPYKNIDSNLKTIEILDPNGNILDFNTENYITVDITQVYTLEQLPDDVVYVGRRGFCDIFYKNDFIGHDNILRFMFDLESVNISGELENSTNYINMMPLAFSTKVVRNDLDYVKIGLSTDGFLRELQDADVTDSYIDPHLYNSLFKGIDVDVYVFPFIFYQDEFYIEGADDLIVDIYQGGFETLNKMYYVPKDLQLQLKCIPVVDKSKGNSSYVNHGLPDNTTDSALVNQLQMDYIIGLNPWFWRVPLVMQDYVDLKFQVFFGVIENADYQLLAQPRLTKYDLKSSTSIIIPKEVQHYQNFNKLLDVYMSHPMFDEADNLKQVFKRVLGDRFINDVMTSSENFLDNTANVKTCYLSNLVSMLKMMGEDVTQFEKGAFDGNNDMRDFVRLLSMNHSDLVGHIKKEQYDIRVNNDIKGKHVGDELFVDDILILNTEDGDNLGKVIGVQRANSKEVKNIRIDGGVDIIVVDKHTNVSRIVTFYHSQHDELKYNIKLGNYDESWGWNLLLPISFTSIDLKISDCLEKSNDGRYSQAARDKFIQDVERYRKVKADMVEGYYRFFLLNSERGERRVGNFINDFYITPQIDDKDNWDSTWGTAHDILMKILIENCYLNNNRKIGGVYEDGDIIEGDIPTAVTQGTIKKELILGSDVPCVVKVNGEQTTTTKIEGKVHINGQIDGVGKSMLTVISEKCKIDDFASFEITAGKIQVRVSYDGSIDENYQTYAIYGNNVYGSLTVRVSGSVEYPIIDASIDVNFIDERVDNAIIFNSDNTYYRMKDYFFTNKLRQKKDSWALMEGYIDNSNSKDGNRMFHANLNFLNPKLGDNVCSLSYTYIVGHTQYDGLRSNSIKTIKGTVDNVKVYVDYNGEISFKDGTFIVPIDGTEEGDVAKGNLYFKLKGNIVLGSHEMRCYSYDPNVDENNQLGIQTIHVQVGGYNLSILENRQGSKFIVDGIDGFRDGYYCSVESVGDICTAVTDGFEVTANVIVRILDELHNEVYRKTLTYTHFATVDENGYILQNDIPHKFNDSKLKGSIVLNTYGGYYDISSFDLALTLK